MYGAAGASTYSATHANTTDSTIKAYLEDTWYPTISEANRQYIVDAIYCNDRSLDTTSTSYTGIGTTTSYYAAYQRLYRNKAPVLTLSQKEDRFTQESANFEIETNGMLEAPVGLITADEVAMAGGVYNTGNTSYYLYSGDYHWTMSSLSFSSSLAHVFYVESDGGLLDYFSVNFTNLVVRPVISLSPSALQYGTGKIDAPFRLSE